MRRVDETGNRYGALVVVAHAGSSKSHQGALWHCHCDCGGWRITTGKQLRKGLVTRCVGCRSLDEAIEAVGVAPCDKNCHFRTHCMTEKMACWPYRMWVTKGEDMAPNPEDFMPSKAIYRNIFENDED